MKRWHVPGRTLPCGRPLLLCATTNRRERAGQFFVIFLHFRLNRICARACFFFPQKNGNFCYFFFGNFKSENKFREKSAARDVFSFVGCFRLKERIIFVELFRLNVGPILEKINLKLWKLETNCQMLVLCWRIILNNLSI